MTNYYTCSFYYKDKTPYTWTHIFSLLDILNELIGMMDLFKNRTNHIIDYIEISSEDLDSIILNDMEDPECNINILKTYLTFL